MFSHNIKQERCSFCPVITKSHYYYYYSIRSHQDVTVKHWNKPQVHLKRRLRQTSLDSSAARIYQEMKATDMKYKNRVRSRISNLKDPKNPGLRKNVLAGTIELSRIAAMSAEVQWNKPMDFPTVTPSLSFSLTLPLSLLSCRRWPVTSWSSSGALWPRRPSGSIRWPRLVAPPLTCCSAASARRKTAPTTRYWARDPETCQVSCLLIGQKLVRALCVLLFWSDS